MATTSNAPPTILHTDVKDICTITGILLPLVLSSLTIWRCVVDVSNTWVVGSVTKFQNILNYSNITFLSGTNGIYFCSVICAKLCQNLKQFSSINWRGCTQSSRQIIIIKMVYISFRITDTNRTKQSSVNLQMAFKNLTPDFHPNSFKFLIKRFVEYFIYYKILLS